MMTKTRQTIDNLSAEIARFTTRISELEQQEREQQKRVARAQADYISGNIQLDAFAAEQTKLSLIKETIESMTPPRVKLLAELKEQEAIEKAELERQQALKRAARLGELKNEFQKLFLAACGQLETTVSQLLPLKTEYNFLLREEVCNENRISHTSEIEWKLPRHDYGVQTAAALAIYANRLDRAAADRAINAREEQRRERETREPKREVILKNPQGKVSSSVNH